MRRGVLLLLVFPGLTLPAGSALGATLPPSFTASCPTESPDGSYGGVRICSGTVTSFDGATMDVDLTQPMQDSGGRHPLIVMLHGFGNDKHEWESTTDEGDGADKYHWNNRWLAKHGYYVLSYSARLQDRPAEQAGPAAHAAQPEWVDERSERNHPREEPRLRDPRHPVAGRPGRRRVPGRGPRPDSRDRRLVRRHRELAPSQPAHVDVPPRALGRRASDPEPAGGCGEVPLHGPRLFARPERARGRAGLGGPLRVLAGAPRQRYRRGQPGGRPEGELHHRAVRPGHGERQLRGRQLHRHAAVHVLRVRGEDLDRRVESAGGPR